MMKPIRKALVPITTNNTYNPYPHFGQSSMWPRGYPLENIGLPLTRSYELCSVNMPVIQQGLVNGHPDVDALFRMTRQQAGVDTRLKFDDAAPAVILPHGVYAPFNAQNTFYTRSAFWSLFLFTTVTDRETDIYRAYWAQRLLRLTGYNVAFLPPTSQQIRNAWHTHIKDARDEARLYAHMGKFVDYLDKWVCTRVFFFDCMTELTDALVIRGFIENRDAKLMSAWVDDLAALGYAPPLIRDTKSTCQKGDVIHVTYHPWEQNTSMAYASPIAAALHTDSVHHLQEAASDVCGFDFSAHVANALATATKFEDVLLVISITGDLQVISILNAIYKIHFPHILYCGDSTMARNDVETWKVTYVKVKESADVLQCVTVANSMRYNVAGYLHITQNHFIKYENLHVGSRNKNQVWISGGDLYVLNEATLNLCGTNDVQCVSLNKEIFTAITRKLHELYPGASKIEQYSKCLTKAGQDPTFKTQAVMASKELAFYVPQSKVDLFNELAAYFMDDQYLKSYGFLSLLIMECVEVTPEYLHSVDPSSLTSDLGHHYDYIFPFLFTTLKTDSLLKSEYCRYIENH